MAEKTQDLLSEKQIKYIQFLARGKKTKQGERRTEEQFAEAIGVNASTTYRWRELPGFAEALFQETIKQRLHHLPTLVDAQLQTGIKGKGGNTQAFMALMRQFELLKSDKVDHTTNGKDLPTPILGGS